ARTCPPCGPHAFLRCPPSHISRTSLETVWRSRALGQSGAHSCRGNRAPSRASAIPSTPRDVFRENRNHHKLHGGGRFHWRNSGMDLCTRTEDIQTVLGSDATPGSPGTSRQQAQTGPTSLSGVISTLASPCQSAAFNPK